MMTPLKCVAIDDEPLALELMETYISQMPELRLLQTFEDAISGAEFLNKNQVDLLFIDINMPDITGVDLVRAMVAKPMVIFTTAYKNFAFEGFELQALDYLLKPIEFKRFAAAVEKAVDFHKYKLAEKHQGDESLYVYSEYRMVKINLRDIEYIESMEDYIKIHVSGNPKPILTLMPLKKVLEKLPETQFRRIHRSYIVALKSVRSIHNRKVQTGSAELPVGNSYSSFVTEWAKDRF